MIYTVTGAIKKDELGAVLGHEHIAWDGGEDIEQLYFEKQYDEEKINRLYNKLLPTFQRLHAAGCGAFVETSPPEGGQNVKLMQALSRASSIKIIPNTGMIFSKRVFEIHRELYATELAERWIYDFENGLDTVEGITVKPAFIKLFMSRGKLPEVDRRILKAAIIASKATGMPLHCHIMETATALEVLELLESEKFDLSKFLWAHAGAEGQLEVIEAAASKGVWIGYDMIKRGSHEKFFKLIKEALDKGYSHKLLLSQDYDFYGEIEDSPDNNPCISLFEEFIPYCERNGISKAAMTEILTRNPAEFLDI